MDKRVIVFFLLPVFLFGGDLDDRKNNALKEADVYFQKKNWLKLLETAKNLSNWGEKDALKKVLDQAILLVMAKESEAGAYQLSFIYRKNGDLKNSLYWEKTAERIALKKKKKWKKS